MRASVSRLLDIYYPLGAEGVRFRDGTVPFYEWITAHVDGRSTVLNVGAGPTPPEPERHMRGKVGKLVGVDPDPIVFTNSDLDEAYVNDGLTLPFSDGVFDAIFSDWTLEHVSMPAPFLAEIYRVLKPGGFFWFRTTNRWHYVTLLAAITPHRFHVAVANRARALDDQAHDPWPTRYRMNDRGRLTTLLSAAGFEAIEIRYLESHPSYLKFHPAAFWLGMKYERLLNRFSVLERFRLIMIGRAQRGISAQAATATPASANLV
jgi:SAM-dependent methyltransferase